MATKILLLAVGLIATLVAQPRKVEGNRVISGYDPEVTIEVPASAVYVGTDTWVLYDIADCEIHVFVEADEQKNVRNYYWIQFEGYIPSKPNSHYNYPFTTTTTLAGRKFDVRTGVGLTNNTPRAGSDTEHVRKLIQSRGYKLPEGMISVRLVNMLDEEKRKELMIIYAEDVGPTGFRAADLMSGGKDSDRWPAIEKQLLETVAKKLKFR